MPMRCWRRLVKSKLQKNAEAIVFASIAITVMLAAYGCQKATPVVEYRKFTNDADVPRIPLDEAKKDVDAGLAIIVDSRAEPAYKQEHIAGSINIPIGSADDKFGALPQGKKIIVYCS